jgi:ArsR family transcriptional regulator
MLSCGPLGHVQLRGGFCRVGFALTGLYISTILEISEDQFVAVKPNVKDVARYADMLSAMGTETRLRIMRLLLTAHPDGLVVGEIGEDLEIPNSTLSHHLDKLKNEGLVCIQREGTFLRCTANTSALEELLGFLYAECCTRNKAVEPQRVVCCG